MVSFSMGTILYFTVDFYFYIYFFFLLLSFIMDLLDDAFDLEPLLDLDMLLSSSELSVLLSSPQTYGLLSPLSASFLGGL